MLTAQRLSHALNSDPFDVIREQDSHSQGRPGAASPSPALSVNFFALRQTGLERFTGIGSDAGNSLAEMAADEPMMVYRHSARKEGGTFSFGQQRRKQARKET
jgi:hypothetical protein